jgi:hypothetical protein
MGDYLMSRPQAVEVGTNYVGNIRPPVAGLGHGAHHGGGLRFLGPLDPGDERHLALVIEMGRAHERSASPVAKAGAGVFPRPWPGV